MCGTLVPKISPSRISTFLIFVLKVITHFPSHKFSQDEHRKLIVRTHKVYDPFVVSLTYITSDQVVYTT